MRKKGIQLTDPVEVVDDPDFPVIILQVIADVVLFHVRADVLCHLVIFVFRELERALQYRNLGTRVTRFPSVVVMTQGPTRRRGIGFRGRGQAQRLGIQGHGGELVKWFSRIYEYGLSPKSELLKLRSSAGNRVT